MVYPFEQAAINGEPMPDGLNFAEQTLFLCLTNLYAAVRSGTYSREEGAKAKRKIEEQYSTVLAEMNVYEHSIDMWMRIEESARTYRQNRTLENADAFMDAVYGVKHRFDKEESQP